MSIKHQVLGIPGRDNALLVEVDSGHAVERLLFDCGDGCLTQLTFSDVQAIDALFLSHLHMDHIGGFDYFFRCTFDRKTKPNHIWGPPQTAQIVQHRFQGFLWNLQDEMSARWHVSDVYPSEIETFRFELGEAFAHAHRADRRPYQHTITEGVGYSVEAITMDHRTPTLAYLVREPSRTNVDTSRLDALGLQPGPWMKQLKEPAGGSEYVEIGGISRSLGELQKALVVETPGETIAYLTDFLLDRNAIELLSQRLHGCDVVICEGQYRHADLELAHKNFHMTTVLSATLAKLAQVGELVLFHLSDRYVQPDWIEMLREARRIFPNTHYPKHWNLEDPPQCAAN